jgi:hypothetical protein
MHLSQLNNSHSIELKGRCEFGGRKVAWRYENVETDQLERCLYCICSLVYFCPLGPSLSLEATPLDGFEAEIDNEKESAYLITLTAVFPGVDDRS